MARERRMAVAGSRCAQQGPECLPQIATEIDRLPNFLVATRSAERLRRAMTVLSVQEAHATRPTWRKTQTVGTVVQLARTATILRRVRLAQPHFEVIVGAVAKELRAARAEVAEPGHELLGRRGGRLVEVGPFSIARNKCIH